MVQTGPPPVGRLHPPDDQAEGEVAFWLRHLVIGIAAFSVAAVAALAYFLATPRGGHRPAEKAIFGVCLMVVVLLVALPRRRIAAAPWRMAFFYGWTAMTCVIIAVAASLDGGPDSPIVLFLFLALLYACAAYPPAGALFAAMCAVVSFGVLVIGAPGSVSVAADLVLPGAVLVLAAGLTVVASGNRRRLEVSRHQLAEQLATLAVQDPLTGCLNHRALYDRLSEQMAGARRRGRTLAVLVLDVDRFKAVNDDFGHLVGDDVLRRLGAVLRTDLRPGDVAGRIGGDEFAIVLPESSEADAEAVAERLLDRIHADLAGPPCVTVTVGLATSEEGDCTGQDVVRRADEQMLRRKRDRRMPARPGVVTNRPFGP